MHMTLGQVASVHWLILSSPSRGGMHHECAHKRGTKDKPADVKKVCEKKKQITRTIEPQS